MILSTITTLIPGVLVLPKLPESLAVNISKDNTNCLGILFKNSKKFI